MLAARFDGEPVRLDREIDDRGLIDAFRRTWTPWFRLNGRSARHNRFSPSIMSGGRPVAFLSTWVGIQAREPSSPIVLIGEHRLDRRHQIGLVDQRLSRAGGAIFLVRLDRGGLAAALDHVLELDLA